MCPLPLTVQPATIPGSLNGHASKSPFTKGKVVGVGAGVGGGITITDTVSMIMSDVGFELETSVNWIVVAVLSAVNVRK